MELRVQLLAGKSNYPLRIELHYLRWRAVRYDRGWVYDPVMTATKRSAIIEVAG